MQKAKWNFWIDGLKFCCLAALAGLGFLIKYVLLPGKEAWVVSGNKVELTWLGLDRHAWGAIHLYLSCLLLGLLVLYLSLNWPQISGLGQECLPAGNWRIWGAAGFLLLCTPLFALPFLATLKVSMTFPGQGGDQPGVKTEIYSNDDDNWPLLVEQLPEKPFPSPAPLHSLDPKKGLHCLLLLRGGRITNEIKAAELILLAEQNRLVRSRQELIFNVTSTYNAILSQQKVVAAVQFSLNAMQEQRRKMTKMVEVGKAAPVDLLRAEVRVADLEQALVKEQNILDTQKRLLATLLGQNLEPGKLELAGDLVFMARPYQVELLIPQALRQRPDFIAARERSEAQAKKVDVARAGHYPNVSLAGAYGYRGTVLGGVQDARGATPENRIALDHAILHQWFGCAVSTDLGQMN